MKQLSQANELYKVESHSQTKRGEWEWNNTEGPVSSPWRQ